MLDQFYPATGNVPNIDGSKLDLSYLVGREVGVFCDQFPGKEIKGRVHSAQDRQLEIEGGSKNHHLENLVNNQSVILQFPYKGQTVSVRALLRRTTGGRCLFLMEEKIIPLSQRRHRRIEINRNAKLAAIPMSTFVRAKLPHLRWLETTTLNFSSGGALIEIPSYLEKGVYLLVHVDVKSELLPMLVLAQVRHCYSAEVGRFSTGVEFVVREVAGKSVSPTAMKELPPASLSYSVIDREKLNKVIQGWTPHSPCEL